jgi:hypothetical protein
MWPGRELEHLCRRDAIRRLLRDVIARVVVAREELELDSDAAARTILADLEDDLVALLERGRPR